ncbi:MAG: hypothetical protein KOO66_01760 [Bacteroidales bacterium]|nr:hypothetical protein [Bacteroidales bacterium]
MVKIVFRYIFVLIVLLLSKGLIYSQSITNINSSNENNSIVIAYKISGAKFNQKFNVSIYYSINDGETFIGPLKAVRGNVGEGVLGGNNVIIWDVFSEINIPKGDIIFDIKVNVIEEEIQKKFYILYTGSIDAPFGLSVGQFGKIGWYISARTSMMISEPTYSYGGAGWSPNFEEPSYYTFNNLEKIRRFSLTIGANKQISRNFFISAGIGYGLKDLVWQMNIYSYSNDDLINSEYVKNPDYSYKGIEAETGLTYRLKNFLITSGVSTVNFQYTNLLIGLGYSF